MIDENFYVFIENYEYDGDYFPIYQHKIDKTYVAIIEGFGKMTRDSVDRLKYAVSDWYEKTFNPEDYDWDDY